MWLVSLFLVNQQPELEKLKDTNWLFQPEMIVQSCDAADRSIFVSRDSARSSETQMDVVYKAEQSAMALIYRKRAEFATGHGASVHSEPDADDVARAVKISTQFVPAYEVGRVTAPTKDDIPALGPLVLDMKELAETAANDLRASLAPLTTSYLAWIDGQEARIANSEDVPGEFRETAKKAIKQCRETLGRIEEGLTLLEKNDEGGRGVSLCKPGDVATADSHARG